MRRKKSFEQNCFKQKVCPKNFMPGASTHRFHLYIVISIIHYFIYMESSKDQGELIFTEHSCHILLSLLYIINSFSFHDHSFLIFIYFYF